MTPAADNDGQDKIANTSTPSTTTTNDCCTEPTTSMVTERVGLERGDSVVENVILGADSSWSWQPTKRSSSLVNAAAASVTQTDDRSAHSENDSELDIYVTDLANFLSSNGDPATVAAYEEHRRNKLNKWSGRRQNLNESPSSLKLDPEEDYTERRRDAICDCDLEDHCGGFVTPPMSSYEPQPWTPDVYESVTRSLKEFRKTYQMQSEACSLDGDEPAAGSSSSSCGSGSRLGNSIGSDGRPGSFTGHMKPFSKADQYVVSLPNMDIEDKAMHIDKLIVKSFRHLNNLTKVRFREMLDDDVITTVMERYKDQHRDILFVTPCITKCVMVLQDHVANFLDPIKAKNYDLIFFVISDASSAENGAAHWSLLLLHRPNKTFYHYDSMHGSHYNAAFELMYKVWSYFKIKKGFQPECEQQPNGVDCGFYVIHNMLRCIRIVKEELYDEDGARITLKEPLKLPLSIDETKSIVIKTYVSSIVDKIKKTTVDKF